MDLHHANPKPDWEYITEGKLSRWQIVAAATRGIVTPGNAASTLGFLMAGLGLVVFIRGNALIGLALVLLGRAVDMFDGLIASRTHTKSPLGASLDASLDKLIPLAA